MKSDHDETRITGLLLSLISLMVALHLGSYVIVALLSAAIGAAVAVAVISRSRR